MIRLTGFPYAAGGLTSQWAGAGAQLPPSGARPCRDFKGLSSAGAFAEALRRRKRDVRRDALHLVGPVRLKPDAVRDAEAESCVGHRPGSTP